MVIKLRQHHTSLQKVEVYLSLIRPRTQMSHLLLLGILSSPLSVCREKKTMARWRTWHADHRANSSSDRQTKASISRWCVVHFTPHITQWLPLYLSFLYVTRVPSNLRQTTRECVHLVMRGYFRSCGKDGGHAIPSAVTENPVLLALCFIEPELMSIEVLHC